MSSSSSTKRFRPSRTVKDDEQKRVKIPKPSDSEDELDKCITFLTKESERSRDEQKKLDSVKETIASLRKDLKASKTREAEIGGELAEMDSIYKQQCEELRQKQDEQDDLKNENARLKASFGALEREEQAIRQRLLALQQRNRALEAELAEVRKDRDDTFAAVREFCDKMSSTA